LREAKWIDEALPRKLARALRLRFSAKRNKIDR
jgi:hypothetical protein